MVCILFFQARSFTGVHRAEFFFWCKCMQLTQHHKRAVAPHPIPYTQFRRHYTLRVSARARLRCNDKMKLLNGTAKYFQITGGR